MTGTKKRLAKMALAVLRLDLGYTKQPVYGWTPMRHQNLWSLVADVLTEQEIIEELKVCQDVEDKEGVMVAKYYEEKSVD